MLLRRITEHVKNENWFAVAIDFFIVVFGVFLGLQIGNWNEAREDQQEYDRALKRFSAEIVTNLETLDSIDKEFAKYLEKASTAFDILQTCEDTPDNRETVNNGLIAITGTYGLNLRSGTLRELTTSTRLLSQQTADERQRFTDMKYYFDLAVREANFVELLPLEERIQNNPIIGIGPPVQREVSYSGADYSRRQRPLLLKVPLDEACENDQLIKSFYTWERWQEVLPALSKLVRGELEKTMAIIEK